MPNIIELNAIRTPDYPMKPEEREVFVAEQQFLFTLMRDQKKEIINPRQKREAFFSYVEDLSATDMARRAWYAYGLEDGTPHSDRQVSAQYPDMGYRGINLERKTIIQTLWLLHAGDYSADLHAFARTLRNKYISTRDEGRGSGTKVYKRAEANISYFEDRCFIRKREEEILALLVGMYGRATGDVFSRLYRLGNHASDINHERQGSYQFSKLEEPGPNGGTVPSHERLMVVDALEAGRAVSEHLTDGKIGEKEWTDFRGGKVRGYRRKGRFFPKILRDYEEQLRIREVLDSDQAVLTPLERKLLLLTTTAALAGEDKKQGLSAFNSKHGTRCTANGVRDLENKVLQSLEIRRLVFPQRKERMKAILTDQKLNTKLAKQLADILFAYHDGKATIRQIADEIGLSEYHTGEFRRMLDRLIYMKAYGTDDLLKRGQITGGMIDNFFRDEKLPTELISLLQKLEQFGLFQDIVPQLNWGIKVSDHAIAAFCFLAEDTVDQSKK